MSLSRRDFEIVSLISKERLTIKELASIFKISDRNIRYSVDNINYYLNNLYGKTISIVNSEAFLDIDDEMLKFFYGDLNRSDYIFSKAEREEYILVYLLFIGEANYSKLEEYLQVTVTTLKKDVKNLSDFLEKFQLCFFIKDGVLSIDGSEKKLRHLKMTFALKYAYFVEKKIIFIEKYFFSDLDLILILKKYLEDKSVEKYLEILENIEKDMGVEFEKEFKKIIIFYLIIAHERIEKGIILDKKNNSSFLKETTQYKIIIKYLFNNDLEKYRYEALHLTEYFLSGFNSETFYENRFSIEIFVYKLLKNVGEKIKIYLEKDKILIEDMIEYLTAAIYRMKNDFILNKQIKLDEENSSLKNYIKEAIILYEDYLNEVLREEEINSIIELIEKSINRKSGLVIDLNKILEIVEKNSKESNLDLIGNEIKNMYPTLVNDNRVNCKEIEVLDILDESRIHILRNVSFKDAISMGCDTLYEEGFVNKEYKAGILELLHSNGHSYFKKEKLTICYGKSTLHSIKVGAQYIILKNHLKGEENVEFILLISNVDKEKHLKIMSQVKFLMEKEGFTEEVEKMEKENIVMKAIEMSLSNISF